MGRNIDMKQNEDARRRKGGFRCPPLPPPCTLHNPLETTKGLRALDPEKDENKRNRGNYPRGFNLIPSDPVYISPEQSSSG